MSTRRDKRDKPQTPPQPVVPANAVAVAKFGGTVALVAAAAMSAQTLYRLGRILGYAWWNAPLLPTSLDVYAATAIWVGHRVPAEHRARKTATTNARIALALTICSNGLFHLLNLPGVHLPHWVSITLLVLVSALPPFVVERILHLQMSVSHGRVETPAVDNPAFVNNTNGAAINNKPPANKPESSTPAINNAASSTTTINPGSAESTSAVDSNQPTKATVAKPKPATKSTSDDTTNADEIHAAAMKPVYEEILQKTGKRPTAPELHRQVPGIGSVTRAQQIRAVVEERWYPEMVRPRFQVVEGGEPLQRTG